ncbi:MAG: MinD/ParA family protein [Mycobacterium sp.]|nr:MinD/ParA family protein [Mycobacterium sp.]
MNNRGPNRGVVQQSMPPVGRQNPPPRRRPSPGQPLPPRARPNPPPWPRQDVSGYRPPPANVGAATVPGTRVPTPPPTHPRAPGMVPLERLDEQETDVPAESGWRARLARLTPITLGPSKEQAYERGLQDRVRVPLGSAFPIAVLNLKGGVGKTAVVEALGSTFAEVRDDRVIAVDVDAGDLADRHGRRNALNMVDLLADRSLARYLDVRAHTHRNGSGLEVLGLPDYAQSEWRIERDDVGKAFSILRNHYSVMLVDCGKALKSSVTQAVLSEARALVVVTNTSIHAIRKTQTTLEWLAHNRYQKLIDSSVLVINHTEQGKPNALVNKELQQLSARFAANRVVVLPFDRHVYEGKEITLPRLSKKSRRGYLELAAALADVFPRRDVAGAAAAQLS